MKKTELKISTEAEAKRWYERAKKYFENDGKPLLVVTELYQEGRTPDQQALIHCIMREIALSSGIGEERFKQDLKNGVYTDFLYWPPKLEKDANGRTVIVRPKSEGELTKKEETELIERLYAFGAVWGVEFKEV